MGIVDTMTQHAAAGDPAPPSARASNDSGGVRSVSRALAVLDAFTGVDAAFSIAALTRHVGLPRTTTLRLVETLVDEGMLAMGDDGLVRVGSRLIRWGSLAEAAWTVPQSTLDRMRALSDHVGETVSLYVRDGLHRTVIAQAQSRHTLRHAVQVGDELPLWGGAAALVLMALEPDSSRDALIDDVVASSEGRVSAADLRSAVALAAEQGFAVTHGGREPGTSGIAVPLAPATRASATSRVAVGLAIGGPTARIRAEQIPAFITDLQATAAEISEGGLPAALQ